MILLIDACVRPESRTRPLAQQLAQRLAAQTDDAVETLHLYEAGLPAMDEATLAHRSACCTTGDFSKPYFRFAKQFAAADRIVIAAPFWDLSFPAALKQYIEAICITGLTFRYSEAGIPIGLCRAQKLYYVTTAGGPIFEPAFGYGYIQMLAQAMFGIPECACLKAENLDIVGSDVDAILAQARAEIDRLQ